MVTKPAKKSKRRDVVTTVDEYLALVEPDSRRALERLRAQIKAAAPGAEERLWYHIPSYVLNGPLLHFAAQPNHLALYAVPVRAFTEYRKELKPFKVTGRTIQFSAENPLPAALVRKIVKMRVRDNSASARKKR